MSRLEGRAWRQEAARELPDDLLAAYARLLVEFGANVQPDQVLRVRAFTGQERPARSLAEAAYRRGARCVDVNYFDPYLKRGRLLHALEETLDFVPSSYGEAVLAMSEQRCGNIVLTGPAPPHLYDDVDRPSPSIGFEPRGLARAGPLPACSRRSLARARTYAWDDGSRHLEDGIA